MSKGVVINVFISVHQTGRCTILKPNECYPTLNDPFLELFTSPINRPLTKDTGEVALDALRVEGVVHRVLGEHDVYDVVADVPLPLQLSAVKINK